MVNLNRGVDTMSHLKPIALGTLYITKSISCMANKLPFNNLSLVSNPWCYPMNRVICFILGQFQNEQLLVTYKPVVKNQFTIQKRLHVFVKLKMTQKVIYKQNRTNLTCNKSTKHYFENKKILMQPAHLYSLIPHCYCYT